MRVIILFFKLEFLFHFYNSRSIIKYKNSQKYHILSKAFKLGKNYQTCKFQSIVNTSSLV